MEKVRLPKFISEAMGIFQNNYGSEALFRIEEYVGKDVADAFAYDIAFWLRKGNHRTYYTALVNGYEVEMTPEEKVVELSQEWSLRELNAVSRTLDALGIKISGVNAE